MTMAICTQCGHIKFGALIECESCGLIPKSLDEQSLSMVLNDRWLDQDSLNNVSKAIKLGQKPPFGSSDLARLIKMWHERLSVEILSYPYRMRIWGMLLCILMPVGLWYLVGSPYLDNPHDFIQRFIHGRPIKVLSIYLIIIFAILFISMLLCSLIFSHRLVLTKAHISMPKTHFSAKPTVVRIADITRIKREDKNGQGLLGIYHTQGKLTVQEYFLPNSEAFNKLCSELYSQIPVVFR